jgi:ribonuclease HI
VLRKEAQEARQEYFIAIEKQKKLHWKDFLNDNQNVWTALKYLKGVEVEHTIPPLQH